MPLLDQAGEGQTGSRSLENSEPVDTTAGSRDATAQIHDPDSKASTQHSSAKRHTSLSPLPLNNSVDARDGEDQTLATLTRSNTPELLKTAKKLPGMTSRELAVQSSSLGGSSGSQGQAALEQAGKFRPGGVDRQQNVSRKKEEREQARKSFAAATLRRFNAKLEGLTERPRTHKEGRKVVTLTVEEQVEKLLLQATSTDNLAQMYEGWTPWI